MGTALVSIGLRTQRYSPLMTRRTGGSIGIGVPLPRRTKAGETHTTIKRHSADPARGFERGLGGLVDQENAVPQHIAGGRPHQQDALLDGKRRDSANAGQAGFDDLEVA